MQFRVDIQALRGWAVGMVLLDHVGIGPFANGHLGVDIFFVISGFLITGIVMRDIERGRFSFRQFILRRAKRILPAALATVLLTVALAPWFLTSLEMRDFTAQVVGTVTFSINFVLLKQVDYFAVEAEVKPLLHMWSLAIEEQYYVLLPALIWFTPRRWWPALIGGLLAASLAACLWLLRTDPAAAFYMLPGRAWELAIGSVGAMVAAKGGAWCAALPLLFWPALVALLAMPVVSTGYPHPGLDAVIVCVATLVVILRAHGGFGEVARRVGLARLGDVSYSLYLVHWPIVAFLNNAFVGGELPAAYRLGAVVLSLALAWALYRFVETPIRNSSFTPRPYLAGAAAASAALVALQSAVASASIGNHWRRPNVGFDTACDGRTGFDLPACRNSDEPRLLVWGDSYAMHLVPGLAAVGETINQATLSACPPIIGISYHRATRPDAQAWAERCTAFNDKVLERLKSAASIETVILSSPWRGFDAAGDIWRRNESGLVRVPTSTRLAAEALAQTVRAIESTGRQVVIVGPPPVLSTPLCPDRHAAGKVTLTDCQPRPSRPHESTLAILAAARRMGVQLVDLRDVICSGGKCAAEMGGVPLYRDKGHLSYGGSVKIIEKARRLGLL